ncbi:MAG: ABC transporter substrate-binding protein [Deltaproteobacteria bacterium HGW-Deltaproteobacteria-18]|jgi:zinc transport system substrate-binding protein|nr:MAG: ABC transporter substrate-binding protein [Deltaproteobacteria bacterium HGW-Deltaproteobacteria-18]
MRKNLCLLTLLLSLFSVSAQAAPSAFVTITPQKYFVDKVSGGEVPVAVMVEPGANPHAYEPRPRQMAELAKASIYFAIGDSFDQTWLERIMGASPKMTVVHTAEGIAKIPMSEEHHHEEDHAGDGHVTEADDAGRHDQHDPDQGMLDPHIWLDPALVRIQVAHIRDGLSRVDPDRADLYAANAAAFERELDELDREIRSILAPLPPEKRTFLVFHPSWGYFAKAYGLTQASIEVDGKEPSPRDLARIIAAGKESGAKVVFVQPQFSQKSATVIAKQIGATVVRLDPLAEDWATNMRSAARACADALN